MTASKTPAPPADRRWLLAVFAVLSAMTLVVLDAGMANVALPALAGALNATPADAVLVVTAYQAGLIMALLPAGALGERFGHRRIFMAGVATFAASSLLCMASPSLPFLIAARLAQGLGGAAIMALGIALLRFSVPAGQFGAAVGWNALTVALASAVAPSLGAAVLSVAGWPALFAVTLPLAAAALASARTLPSTPRKPDGPGFAAMALNAIGFGLLIVAAGTVLDRPGLAALLLVAGALAFGLLVRGERFSAAPLIPLDLLRIQPVRLSAIASVCCFAAQTGGLMSLAFLLQHGLDQTPLAAGLCMTAWPLAVAPAAVLAGRLADRTPTAWLCAAGGFCLSGGLAGAATLPATADPRMLLPWIALCGLGFGLFQSPNNRNLFLSAPLHRGGAAGGLQGSARVSGQTLGALMVALLFQLTTAEATPTVALAIAAILAMTSAIVSLFRGLGPSA